MKNILITGGLGHIGSKLIRVLLKKKYFVPCIDNLSTQRIVSLKGVLANKNFSFIENDVANDKKTLEKIVNLRENFALIHLAAITNAEASLENPSNIFNNNLAATRNVSEISSKYNIKLIFPSSTSVYGSAEKEVYEDQPSFLNPQSPYAECKIQEENLLLEKDSLDVNILRFGTIFGTSPGMRFHTAVNKFCWQAALRKPITVWETAMNQYRPYLDLEDACESFLFLIDNQFSSKNVFNVLTSNYTVKEILKVIERYVKKLDVEYVETKIMNQLSYKVLNNKIINLGFKFKGDIDKGIKDTLDWLRNE